MFSTPSNAWLEAVDGTTVPVRGNCSLGRSSKNSVVIKSDRASRNHSTIHAQDAGEYWLIDLGSVNGTFLNERRVSQPTRLQDGDRVRIAEFQWVFRQMETQSNDSESMDDETMATMTEVRSIPCWLLLADIENFTPLSHSLDAESLATLVGQWVRAGRDLIGQHGGEINKYLGDGYLAYWQDGVGVAERVAAAGAGMRAMQMQGIPPFRMILHCGTVAMGGSASMGEESLMGPEVNLIFRLEKLAGALSVPFAFSEAAAATLAPWLPSEPVEGAHELKGFQGTHRLFRLRA